MVLPATTVLPKLLTVDWISTLEMENTMPCRPAGRPTLAICQTLPMSSRSFFSSTLMAPSLRIRHSSTSAAEMTWEMIVASATPDTPMWNTITNSKFSSTFTTPAMVR